MNGVIYIVGLIVVVMFILSFPRPALSSRTDHGHHHHHSRRSPSAVIGAAGPVRAGPVGRRHPSGALGAAPSRWCCSPSGPASAFRGFRQKNPSPMPGPRRRALAVTSALHAAITMASHVRRRRLPISGRMRMRGHPGTRRALRFRDCARTVFAVWALGIVIGGVAWPSSRRQRRVQDRRQGGRRPSAARPPRARPRITRRSARRPYP